MRIFVYFIGMTSRRHTATQTLLHQAFHLFEHLPDIAFFVKNERSEFVYANASVLAMLGVRSLNEIRGRTDRDFSPRELADRFMRDDRQVLRSGRPITSRVELVRNSDNSISWHITTKIPLRTPSGRIVGLAGITRDLNRVATTAVRYRDMSAVMQHLDKHYAEPLRVGRLAALAHLSVSQFERRFKMLFQITPVQYVIRLRLNKASQQLMASNVKIAEVATQCGFYDHSHFIRQFTRTFGLSPRRYRIQHTL